jgi:hypothetical protein
MIRHLLVSSVGAIFFLACRGLASSADGDWEVVDEMTADFVLTSEDEDNTLVQLPDQLVADQPDTEAMADQPDTEAVVDQAVTEVVVDQPDSEAVVDQAVNDVVVDAEADAGMDEAAADAIELEHVQRVEPVETVGEQVLEPEKTDKTGKDVEEEWQEPESGDEFSAMELRVAVMENSVDFVAYPLYAPFDYEMYRRRAEMEGAGGMYWMRDEADVVEEFMEEAGAAWRTLMDTMRTMWRARRREFVQHQDPEMRNLFIYP